MVCTAFTIPVSVFIFSLITVLSKYYARYITFKKQHFATRESGKKNLKAVIKTGFPSLAPGI